jgi:hypothetical protein
VGQNDRFLGRVILWHDSQFDIGGEFNCIQIEGEHNLIGLTFPAFGTTASAARFAKPIHGLSIGIDTMWIFAGAFGWWRYVVRRERDIVVGEQGMWIVPVLVNCLCIEAGAGRSDDFLGFSIDTVHDRVPQKRNGSDTPIEEALRNLLVGERLEVTNEWLPCLIVPSPIG